MSTRCGIRICIHFSHVDLLFDLWDSFVARPRAGAVAASFIDTSNWRSQFVACVLLCECVCV